MDDMAPGSARWSSVGLAVRSLIWTILLPGVVVGYVPWRFFGLGHAPFEGVSALLVAGGVCMIGGAALLAECIFEFASSGRGTLSPADPPRQLVVRGLYRYVRNPMYLAVTVILLGEVLVTRSPRLAWYWAVWFLAANLFVIGYEEPTLRRRFGVSYDVYVRRVRRWWPTP